MTRQKALILEIVENTTEHPTAERIFALAKERMPSIVMATVYNNLNALTEEGRIRRISVAGEADRYDNIRLPHEHLRCEICGALRDIPMADLLPELQERTGIELTGYRLELRYHCDACRKKENQNK